MITPKQSQELFLVKKLKENHSTVIESILEETANWIKTRDANKMGSPLIKDFLSTMTELFEIRLEKK